MKHFKPLTKEKKTALLLSLFAVAFMAVIGVFVGIPLVRFASEPDAFRQWVDGHGIGGRLAFIGMVVMQVVIAVIPGEPFELAAGYAFGAVEGTFLCILASTLGSLVVFFAVRKFGMRLVRLFFPPEKIEGLHFLKTSPKRDFLFLIIFMIPGTPKDLLCYFAGLTDLKWQYWLLICSVGRIPSLVTSTLGGDALGTRNYFTAIVVFAVTLALSGAGLLIYRLICKKKQVKESD